MCASARALPDRVGRVGITPRFRATVVLLMPYGLNPPRVALGLARGPVRAAVRFGPLVALILALILSAPGGKAEKWPSLGAATEHPLCTQAALSMMSKGGNAADAIAAAALVGGVVSPMSSGLGGGGFALIYRDGDEEPTVLDFRETAPRTFDPSSFESSSGWEARGRWVGVPGEVAGLYRLVRRFGRLSWAEVVAPAERTARLGFAAGRELARSLSGPRSSELIRDPSLRRLYFPGGSPLVRGFRIRNRELAGTLRRIAEEGPKAFYEGPIASELAQVVRGAGGTLSVDDLRAYAVKERKPLRGTLGEYTIFTMPPPSAGGLQLLQTIGMLSVAELTRLGWNSGAYQHLLAEAFRASLADRLRFIGDPDHTPVETERLIEPERLRQRRKALSLDRTHSTALFVSREAGTHHLSVMDATGLTVALTTTVNRSFGAKLVAPDSGIVLNDELADFTLRSDLKGLSLTKSPNSPRPLARPVSSMTPTIVTRQGRAVLAIGGSGGPTIPTSVAQLLLGYLVFGKHPEELVKSPRFYVFHSGPTMVLEPDPSPALLRDLLFRGERPRVQPMRSGVQLVARDGSTLRAAADPRKSGQAEVR